MEDTFDSLSLRVGDVEKVFSAVNLYHCWQALGYPDREPTATEAVKHWLKNTNPCRPKIIEVSDETCATEGFIVHDSHGHFQHESSD